MRKEDINVSIDANQVTISAEAHQEKKRRRTKKWLDESVFTAVGCEVFRLRTVSMSRRLWRITRMVD